MAGAEKGVLSSSNPSVERHDNAIVDAKVKVFYLSDDVSRIMPDKKDFVDVDGKRVHQQKRLLLCNLRKPTVSSNDATLSFSATAKGMHFSWS